MWKPIVLRTRIAQNEAITARVRIVDEFLYSVRTIDPANIKSDFLSGIDDVRQTVNASEASNLALARKNFVYEFAFLSVATLLEGFISDLFVAYINRDPSKFKNQLVSQMIIETTDKYSRKATGFAQIAIAKHLSATEIRSVLDEREFNITFATVDAMKEGAGRWFVEPHRGYFTGLTTAHAAQLVAIKEMRDFLAHRSSASKREMQNALANQNLPLALRRGQHNINNVGSFLRARPTPQANYRIQTYLDSLEALGNTLCP